MRCWARSCSSWRDGRRPAPRLALDRRAELAANLIGLAVGGLAGWLVSGLLNRVFGWIFYLFNKAFDAATIGLHPDGRRPAAGQRPGAPALRRAAGPDLLGLHPDPHRLHPAAGQGLFAGQRAAARLVVAGADPEGDGDVEAIAGKTARASRTPWRSPASRS